MPRLPEVPRAEVRDPRVLATYDRIFGDRDPVARADGGSGGSWWTVFALEPGIVELIRARHEWQLSSDRALDPTLRELALTRTGWLAESTFVHTQHAKAWARLGATPEQLEGLASWPVRTCWSDAERAVLTHTDALVAGHGRVSDAAFAELRAHLTDVAILELTFLVTTYLQSAVICRALRLESDDVDDRLAPSATIREEQFL